MQIPLTFTNSYLGCAFCHGGNDGENYDLPDWTDTHCQLPVSLYYLKDFSCGNLVDSTLMFSMVKECLSSLSGSMIIFSKETECTSLLRFTFPKHNHTNDASGFVGRNHDLRHCTCTNRSRQQTIQQIPPSPLHTAVFMMMLVRAGSVKEWRRRHRRRRLL